jgi:DNA-directed RNA polymerase specialized sigma24 family protein
MPCIMIHSNNPVEFVEANRRELRGLVKVMCQRFSVPDQEDVFSELITELLQGRHQYDPNKRGLHHGRLLPVAVTTYMYSVVRFFVMNWKNKEALNSERMPLDFNINIEQVPDRDDFSNLEAMETWRLIRRSLMKVAMGKGTRIRLFLILKRTLAGIGCNEIARRMGLSNALVSYHLRAIRIFSRAILSGTPVQEAWEQARPALLGNLAGN